MFYSLDSDEMGKLLEGANIQYVDEDHNMKAIEKLVESVLPVDMGWMTLTIAPARFGDCWRKFTTDPRSLPKEEYAPFDLDDLIILAPGQHPGQPNQWWLTPRDPVYVVF